MQDTLELQNAFSSLGDKISRVIDQKLGILEHASMSPEEFAANRIWVVDLKKNVRKLIPNPIQLLHQQKKREAVKAGKQPHFLVLKYRRGGITTWEQMLSYQDTVTVPNSRSVTLTPTKEDTQGIFEMVRFMAQMDPNKPTDLDDTTHNIKVPSINTRFQIATAGSTSGGRGVRYDRVHGSEVSRWNGTHQEIDDLIYGLQQTAMYGELDLETTANGALGWYYETYMEAMKGENSFTPLFYPWFIDPLNIVEANKLNTEEFWDEIDDEEKEVMKKYNLSLNQMLWRRLKRNANKKLFPQEFPEEALQAFIVRGSIFFDQWDFDTLERNVGKPLEEHNDHIIWERPQPGEEYCIGVDTSGGESNSDLCVAGIINKRTGNQAAVLRGRWKPDVFGRKIVDWAKKYNEAMVGVELNNHGHSVMNTIMNTMSYPHIYYHVKDLEKTKKGAEKQELKPGWLTTGATRPILLDDLEEAVRKGWMKVNDLILLSEGRTFVDHGGKYEAAKGQKDDSVIAWGVAWQVRKQRKKVWIYT